MHAEAPFGQTSHATADHCCAYQVAAVVAVKLQKYRADEEAVLLDLRLDVALDPSDRILSSI